MEDLDGSFLLFIVVVVILAATLCTPPALLRHIMLIQGHESRLVSSYDGDTNTVSPPIPSTPTGYLSKSSIVTFWYTSSLFLPFKLVHPSALHSYALCQFCKPCAGRRGHGQRGNHPNTRFFRPSCSSFSPPREYGSPASQ